MGGGSTCKEMGRSHMATMLATVAVQGGGWESSSQEQTVFITATGAWNLGGFGSAIPVDQASGGLTSTHQFYYSIYEKYSIKIKIYRI